jgi:endonuclease YncB( thermonuclease family)
MIKARSAFRHAARWLVVANLLAPPAARCESIQGTVVEVAKGDTISVLDSGKVRHKVRLAGIAAPESRQAFGPDSRKNLSDLLLGRKVRVERRKEDNYGRVVGRVVVQPPGCETCAPTRDAGLAQLEAGLAWWYREERREQPLEEQGYYEYAEFDARARRIGLWRDVAPVPPWEWRKRENKVSRRRLTPASVAPSMAAETRTSPSPACCRHTVGRVDIGLRRG